MVPKQGVGIMAWVPVMDQLTGMSQCSAAPPSPLPFRPPPRLVRVGEQRCAIYGLRVWHDDGSGIVWYWNGRRHWDVVARGPSAASSLRNRKREVSLLVEREGGGCRGLAGLQEGGEGGRVGGRERRNRIWTRGPERGDRPVQVRCKERFNKRRTCRQSGRILSC